MSSALITSGQMVTSRPSSPAAAAALKNSPEILTQEQAVPSSLWLHVKWKYDCYLLYAEYYYEAWVTSVPDPAGPQYPVRRLTIRWRHGSTRGEENLDNASMIAKSDRVVANGPVCDTDNCLIAIAERETGNPFEPIVTWGSSTPEGCGWA